MMKIADFEEIYKLATIYASSFDFIFINVYNIPWQNYKKTAKFYIDTELYFSIKLVDSFGDL